MTSASVNWSIPIGVAEYVVLSSDRYDEKLGAQDWSSAVHTQVANCCRKGGRAKGRVLHLLEGRSRAPVAVLCYHLESKNQLEIRIAESALAVKEREAEFVAVLLVCTDAILRKQPSRQGPAYLVWRVSKGEVSELRDRYKFTSSGIAGDGRTLMRRRASGTN
jgi:hypothetical protein